MKNNYKLIDENWIDRTIAIYKNNIDVPNKEVRLIYKAKLETLETIKKNLQSPKQEISEAFEAGQSSMVILTEDYTLERYLKENGYDK